MYPLGKLRVYSLKRWALTHKDSVSVIALASGSDLKKNSGKNLHQREYLFGKLYVIVLIMFIQTSKVEAEACTADQLDER